jgi:hypothetical protein
MPESDVRDSGSRVTTSYRIDSVERPASAAEHRRHITGLTTVDSDGAVRHWNDIALVRAAMARGDYFFTQRVAAEKAAPVESYDCPCGVETIRSSLGHPTGHNLDNVAITPLP